jgi:hypothetical protein
MLCGVSSTSEFSTGPARLVAIFDAGHTGMTVSPRIQFHSTLASDFCLPCPARLRYSGSCSLPGDSLRK